LRLAFLPLSEETVGGTSPSNCYSHGKGGNYGKDQIDCSIRRCTYGSKKRIYDAEYGYDMNNNVSKFTSSTGGVNMTERFDYTISLSKPARRRKYKVQNAALCGGVFCA